MAETFDLEVATPSDWSSTRWRRSAESRQGGYIGCAAGSCAAAIGTRTGYASLRGGRKTHYLRCMAALSRVPADKVRVLATATEKAKRSDGSAPRPALRKAQEALSDPT